MKLTLLLLGGHAFCSGIWIVLGINGLFFSSMPLWQALLSTFIALLSLALAIMTARKIDRDRNPN